MSHFCYEYINKQASIIQIEIEQTALGRYFPISIGICADAKTVAKQLYSLISSKKDLNYRCLLVNIFIRKKCRIKTKPCT